MNILGLVASGRKLGNSEILAKEMLEMLEGEKRLLRLSELSIEPCRACYACLPSGKACIIKDHLAYFLEQIEWADAIVIAVPCYFLGAHTSIKTIGDRLISVLNDGDKYRGKPCVAAIPYGVPGWEGYAREMVMNFARVLQLDLRGTLLVCAANPGEVAQPEILSQAHALANRLLLPAQTAAEASACTCPECGSSLLKIDPSGRIRCPMCDTTGRLEPAGDQIRLNFDPAEHSRFSAAGLAEHGRRLEEIKQEYIAKRRDLSTVRKQYERQDSWWVHPVSHK